MAIGIGTVIATAGSVVGGALSNISSRRAAKAGRRAQEAANAEYLQATTKNAERQRSWDKEIAQDSYEANVRAADLEHEGAVAGLNIQGRALTNLRNQTAASYGREIEHTADMSRMELDNMLRSTAESARISTFMNVSSYQARKGAIMESLANTQQEVQLSGQRAERLHQERKSDIAMEADRSEATMRVAAGEAGAAGSAMYTRMVVANASLEGREMARADADFGDEIKSLNHGLQAVASNAKADLQMVEIDRVGTQLGIAEDVRDAHARAAMFVKEQNAAIENLAIQSVFDLEAIDLEGEGLNLSASQAAERRNLHMEMLKRERDTANDFADFIFDQTVTSAEAQASAGDALAAANASAQRRAANTSFMTGVASTGFNILGDYFTSRASTANLRNQLIT